MAVLGLDTSNYTTSLAVFDGREGINVGKLLAVRPGELGLRQSEALFQHIRQLPQLMRELEQSGQLKNIIAVGASTRPRAVEGSYMPCFLAGASQGEGLASALGVPFYENSHQQGRGQRRGAIQGLPGGAALFLDEEPGYHRDSRRPQPHTPGLFPP